MRGGGAKRVFRKEGGALAPGFSLAGKTGEKHRETKIKRRCIKNVKEK
jgi:hypothetical protein